MIVMEQQELMNQSYQHIKWSLSGNRKIRYKSRRLKYEYGLEDDEIINGLFDEFSSRKIYEKITPDKDLPKFFYHTTNYGLSGKLRKQKQEKRNYPFIYLDAFAEESADGYCGSAISFLEKLGADGLVEYTTPEDLVIAKELMNLIIDHFGEDDTKVLLGYSDRQAEAKRLSISYFTYCKRLSRKIDSFLPILKSAGYC